MQLFSAVAKTFFKKSKFFLPTKVAQKKFKTTFFPLVPELPKQKDLCSKMWLIYQLYIELGLGPYWESDTFSRIAEIFSTALTAQFEILH